MKKLAITGAAAALAAMPAFGAFAANSPIVDHVQVTVSSVCNISTGSSAADATVTGANLTATVNPGTLVTSDGTAGATAWTGSSSTIKYSCNNANGYTITAQGVAGATGEDATTGRNWMKKTTSTAEADGIATGTETSGTPSKWAFKVATNGINGATAAFSDWSAVPATASPVITATGANPASEATLQPSYRVWVAADQAQGTYDGYVKYILTANNS